MSRLRLGPDFTRLLSATISSNLGDGIRLTAGPLLVASLTQDPVLVAMAVFAQQLPWLLIALPAGAYLDRLDRCRVVTAVNLARAALVGAFTVLLATGTLSLPLLYLVLFLVGVAEVVADNASSALVPTVVADEHLPRAYARLGAAFVVSNQLVGPPLGAWLFTAGAAWAFGLEAAAFVLAAVLLTGIRRRTAPEPEAPLERTSLHQDIREGVVWLWRQHTVRLLAVVLAVMNVTFSAAFSVWVLLAQQRLGVTEVGFGLLLTASAVGGLTGAALAGRLNDRFGPGTLLRVGLLTETAVLLALAMTTQAWVAGIVMVAFGAHTAVWGAVATTVRQRLVPDRLRARVGSVYFLLVMGGSAVGALVGGFLARWLGLTGPFWIAAAVDGVLLLTVWRSFTSSRLTPPHVSGAEHQEDDR